MKGAGGREMLGTRHFVHTGNAQDLIIAASAPSNVELSEESGS